MSVSFVAPKLGRVMHDWARDLYFRVIEEYDDHLLVYELPALKDILALCRISRSEYDKLCVQHRKWRSGDTSASPVLAHGAPAGPEQAPRASAPAPRFMSKTKSASVKSGRAQDAAELQWQVRNDQDLLTAYNEQNERYAVLGQEWNLYTVYSNKVKDEAKELTLEELIEVDDPVAPLLRTAHTEAEATKIATLTPLVADLDLFNLHKFNLQMQGSFIFRIALNLKVPCGFAQHLLNTWCIFGATPEGLMYTKEHLAIKKCPSTVPMMGLLRAFMFQSDEIWAQDNFWGNLYDLMVRKFLWDHEKEALASGGVLTEKLGRDLWDQAIYGDFGAAIIKAFGGPKHSFLWQFQHSSRFAPNVFASSDAWRALEFIFKVRNNHQGCFLEPKDMDRFGINPFYVHGLMPLPHKDGFVFDAQTRAKHLVQADYRGMGEALECAAQALERGFYPESLWLLDSPEHGCSSVGTGTTLADVPKVSARQAPLKQLVPIALQEALALNGQLTGMLVLTITEPDLATVKTLAEKGIVRFVYGVADPKHGAWTTGAINELKIDHELEVNGGVRADECQHLIDLYQAQHPKRARKKADTTASSEQAEAKATAKKATEVKASAKKPAAKKTTEAKVTVKKPAAKKASETKATVKKPAAKKPAAKKAEATEAQSAPVKRGRRRAADTQVKQ